MVGPCNRMRCYTCGVQCHTCECTPTRDGCNVHLLQHCKPGWQEHLLLLAHCTAGLVGRSICFFSLVVQSASKSKVLLPTGLWCCNKCTSQPAWFDSPHAFTWKLHSILHSLIVCVRAPSAPLAEMPTCGTAWLCSAASLFLDKCSPETARCIDI